MTRPGLDVVLSTVGAMIVFAVLAHWMGWWVVPLGLGVGLYEAGQS